MSPDPITRLNAALEGRYRVERKLGEGGMATVYLARDEKHNRRVALKVLRPELAAVVGAERFLAEIQTTANLQHPHILPLHDSGEADGLLFFAMPFVEGESLRDRLDRERQLPVDDAVRIATNVAEALDYAHRHGVIHRDIKPANVMLHDGKPVVADFGIALAVSSGGESRLTETGMSLGTPQYMSPEQVAGDQIGGPATDVYALGCVLYEMLVGEPPFSGGSRQALLGRIITGEIEPVAARRKKVPPNVDAAVAMALEKVPADRFQTAQAFAAALNSPDFRPSYSGTTRSGATSRPLRGLRYAIIAAALALAVWVVASLSPERDDPAWQMVIDLPDGTGLASEIRLLPDRSGLLYRGANPDGDPMLWALTWAAFEPTRSSPLPGTERVRGFDLSPDGREVALIIGDSIRVRSLASPSSRLVAPEGAKCCLRWNEGWIYYTDDQNGLSRVPVGGGGTERLTVNTGPELIHAWPAPLPGGGRFVFEKADLFGLTSRLTLLDGGSGETTDLGEGRRPSSLGGLIFFTSRNGATLSVAELEGSALGNPLTIVEGATEDFSPESLGTYDLSSSGDLGYWVGTMDSFNARPPVWVSRDGRAVPLSPRLTDFPNFFRELRLSPDGRRIAFRTRQTLYVAELPDGPVFPVTRDGTVNRNPRWTADGSGLYYVSDRLAPGVAEDAQVFLTRADGSGEPEAVDLRAADAVLTPDGRTWVYRTQNLGETQGDLMMRGKEPGSQPVALVATGARESYPTLSRDGRWIAYSSDIDVVREVYVRPFPDARARRWKISLDGGDMPLFSPSTDELFYVDSDGAMLAVQYDAEHFEVVERKMLFDASGYALNSGYDVSRDADRFVLSPRVEIEPNRWVMVFNALRAVEELRAR